MEKWSVLGRRTGICEIGEKQRERGQKKTRKRRLGREGRVQG